MSVTIQSLALSDCSISITVSSPVNKSVSEAYFSEGPRVGRGAQVRMRALCIDMELNQLILVDVSGSHSGEVGCEVAQVLDVAVCCSATSYVPIIISIVNHQIKGNCLTLAVGKGFSIEGVEVSVEKFHN